MAVLGPSAETPAGRARLSAWLADRRWQEAGLIAGSGIAMIAIFLMVRTSLIDDAYITLAYAKNLALHLHWGIVPQEVSNTATSPLNVALLGALTAVTTIGGGVHPVVALGVLSVALAMVIAWCWTRLLRVWQLPPVIAVLGVAVVLVNPFLLSAIGLEVLLVPALLLLLVVTGLEGRAGWFGVVAGLTVLARLDLVVFVLLIAATTPVVRRRWPLSAAMAVAVAAPWFVGSWFLLGSAVPDTLLIKTTQHSVFAPWAYLTGPVMYWFKIGDSVVAAFLPALVGLLCLIGWLLARTAVRPTLANRLPAIGPAAGLALGAVGCVVVFTLLGVPPYHWYYVPPTVALATFGVLAVGLWWQRAREAVNLRPAVPALALALVALIALATLAREVKQGTPWRAPLITTNFGTAKEYASAGLAMRRQVRGATVENQGEVGTIAFFCGCALVEGFSDRGRLMPVINDRIRRASPLKKLLYSVNYAWLDRSQQPRAHQYTLRHAFGPAPARDPNLFPLFSPWSGPGHVALAPAP